MNVEKLLLEWQIKKDFKNFAYTTNQTYKCNIKAFLCDFAEKERPEDVTLEELKVYLSQWPSVNTQYVKKNSIKSFYTIMEITSIDFDCFDKPKRVKVMPQKIDYNFLLYSINEIDNRKHKALLALAFSTGMWLGEMLDLKLADIDFDKNLILVRNKKVSKNRIITLSPEVNIILKHYIRKFKPFDYLFNGQNLPQFNNRSAQDVVKKCIGENCTFIMIRNTHIYFLVESGLEFERINKHLGYENASGNKRLNQFKKYSVKSTSVIKLPI